MKFGKFVQNMTEMESGQAGAITLLVGTFAVMFLAALLTPTLVSSQSTAKGTGLTASQNQTVDASTTIYLVLPAMAGISVIVSLFR